ncbi:hypothetical protein WDV91_08495 [Curtobacterium flaccumfaciens pv. flaccumfaciens]
MPRRRAAVRTAVVVVIVLLVGAVLGAVFVAAPWLGVGRAPVLAAVLPARSLVTAGLVAAGLALVLVAVVLRRTRLVRLVAASLGALLLVVAVANTAVLGMRGWDVRPVDDARGALRVFEWNTNGGLVGPQGIARAALTARADVVVLPDVGDRRAAAAVARAMGQHGRPVRLFMGGAGTQVAVLVGADRASGASMSSGVDPAKTMTVSGPSIPTIVAVHAPQPIGRGLAGWRTDLRWVGEQCGRGADVVVSGGLQRIGRQLRRRGSRFVPGRRVDRARRGARHVADVARSAAGDADRPHPGRSVGRCRPVVERADEPGRLRRSAPADPDRRRR